MTDSPGPEYEADLDGGPRRNLTDLTLEEMTPEEDARFAAIVRRDNEQLEAARKADAEHAAWKAANPEAAAEQETAAKAEAAAFFDGLGLERLDHHPEPEPEAEIG
jgi:hypothetical protein